MKSMLKEKRKYLLPLAHVLLSFFYERGLFLFGQEKDVILSIARNQVVSDAAEQVMGYVISKLFAVILIFFLWQLVFYIVGNWREKRRLRLFLIVFAVGALGILFLWPDPFIVSEDNYITYSYALRFMPEYWHSAYTSCVYAAILMVFPHPVFLTIFQWIFGVFVLGYLYGRIEDSPVLCGRGKRGVFLVFLMPGAYTLFTNSYRTEIYALLCMFLVSMTAMDLVDRRQRGTFALIGNLFLCGLISVWRTEGIILGLLLFALQLLFLYPQRPAKKALYLLCMLASFGLFSVPQKLGDIKYYGKDYSFINSFPTLKNILASPDANLSYDGAPADLAALEAVAPVELLRYYGMDGYRRYNFANGRHDINQSLATDETAAAYMSAFYRMTAHNLPIYAKTQLFMLLKALMILPNEYVIFSDQAPERDLPPWTLESWSMGREDLLRAAGVEMWESAAVRKGASSVILRGIGMVSGILQKIYFYSLILILIPLYEVFLFFREGVRFLKKKDAGGLGLAGIAFILLGQAAAICLVMPAGTLVYFHAYYYCSAVLCLIDVSRMRNGEREQGS